MRNYMYQSIYVVFIFLQNSLLKYFQDCSHLLKLRGKFMNEAISPNKSGMAALIGLNCDKIQEIINNENLKIQIANDNSPIQVVISGINENLEKSKIIF